MENYKTINYRIHSIIIVMIALLLLTLCLGMQQTQTVAASHSEQAVTINGFTFLDRDRVGQQDAADMALSEITIKLYQIGSDLNRATAQLVDTQMTDQNGLYSFDAVEPGSYYIVFITLDSNQVDITERLKSLSLLSETSSLEVTCGDCASDDIDSDAVIVNGSYVTSETETFVVASDTLSFDAGYMEVDADESLIETSPLAVQSANQLATSTDSLTLFIVLCGLIMMTVVVCIRPSHRA